jgi:uncharacterized surface protein with fasciclin (FAS1) repeats
MNRTFTAALFGVLLALAPAVQGGAQAKDLLGTAQDAGTFTVFLTAVKAAGLTDTLMSPGPFTVFAPTDDAFAKLPRENLQKLLQTENKEKLKKILIHHLVDGRATSRDFLGKRLEAATMDGGSLLIDATKTAVTIDGVRVVKTDIIADNGIIHVIDTVLAPP